MRRVSAALIVQSWDVSVSAERNEDNSARAHLPGRIQEGSFETRKIMNHIYEKTGQCAKDPPTRRRGKRFGLRLRYVRRLR